MNKIKIQIIVPLYNMENYISQTLNSLLVQTFSDFEVLCINDGSTDASLSILENYATKDQRINVFTKENGGIADARNYGLSKVTAPYFAFLDSDDTVEPDMLEKLYQKAIESNADVKALSLNNISIPFFRAWLNAKLAFPPPITELASIP